MKQKILIVTPHTSNPGGIANYFLKLKLDENDSIDYHFLNSFKQRKSILTLLQSYVSFLFKVYKYDIIHLNPPLSRVPFYRELPFLIIAKIVRKKTIVFFHGGEEIFYRKIISSQLLKFIFNHTYGKVDGWILLGKVFREKYQKIGKYPQKCFIETTFADDTNIKEFDLAYKLELKKKNEWKILFLARIDYLKGTDIAIKTFKILQDKYPNISFKLLIAGDGPLLYEMQKLSDGIKNIEFLGYLKGIEKDKVFRSSDIYFFPTCYGEGLPISILEAMLYGLPIISRINGGIPDVVEQGINGYLTDSKEPTAFTKFFDLIINDIEKYKFIAVNNYKKANLYYTPDKIKTHLLSIYSEVAGE